MRIWRIISFLGAVVNVPIQTLIIPPWLLLRKMIISQLELGLPVISSVGSALHRCRKGLGFKSCPGLNFFSGLISATNSVVFIVARISYVRFFTAVHIYDFHISTIINHIFYYESSMRMFTSDAWFAYGICFIECLRTFFQLCALNKSDASRDYRGKRIYFLFRIFKIPRMKLGTTANDQTQNHVPREGRY